MSPTRPEFVGTSLAVTALETLEWFKAEPEERRLGFALNLERDAEMLVEWKARGTE